jgi:hypothetical protein
MGLLYYILYLISFMIYGEICKLESQSVAYPGFFSGVGGSTNSVRTEGRENEDLRAVTP